MIQIQYLSIPDSMLATPYFLHFVLFVVPSGSSMTSKQSPDLDPQESSGSAISAESLSICEICGPILLIPVQIK
ncbi:MAG: hypothetical protein DWH81_00565 [Planctomycetota bacterium]|nr:MAG: hypothetical protein DWH81_00565 [Planctomycetota bacterium]